MTTTPNTTAFHRIMNKVPLRSLPFANMEAIKSVVKVGNSPTVLGATHGLLVRKT